MAKVNKAVTDNEVIPFTGIARTVECYSHQGFRNFRMLTLTIEDGRVVAVEKSDPYASFEVISRMELANELSVIHLNNCWEDGKGLLK